MELTPMISLSGIGTGSGKRDKKRKIMAFFKELNQNYKRK
jgi:hypothetical protein